MSHYPKPFFKKSRNRWYVEINRRQINLGPDRDEAFRKYHRIMAEPHEQSAPRTDSVVLLVDRYLEWCQNQRAAETYRWYLDLLRGFCRYVGGELAVSAMKPYHVQRWVDSRPNWSSGSRRNAIAAVKRVFNWAEEQGYVDRSPIAHLKKPKCGKKDTIVPQEHYDRMIALTRDKQFHDLLTVTWETGCRPQESLRVEARHVDRVNQRWVIPETPGKPDMRIVYMPDAAMLITEKLAMAHPEGSIFRNKYGRP